MKKRLFFSAIFFNLLFVVPLIAQNSDAGQENTGPSSLFNYFFSAAGRQCASTKVGNQLGAPFQEPA